MKWYPDKDKLWNDLVFNGVAVVIFLFITWKAIALLFYNPVDISNGNFDKDKHLVGTNVSITVDEVYGKQKYTYTTRYKRAGSKVRRNRKVTDYYYYVAVTDKAGETYILCVKTKENKELAAMDNIFELNKNSTSQKLRYNSEVYFEGTLKSIPLNVYGEMQREIRQLGIYANDEELGKHVLPYELVLVEKNKSKLYLFFGVGFLIIFICSYRAYKRAMKRIAISKKAQYPIVGEDQMKIGKFVVKCSLVSDINEYIINNEDDKAIEELSRRFKLDEDDARILIADWYAHYK